MIYTIVSDETARGLVDQICDHFLKKGWKPQGGVCHFEGCFHQSMVKNERKTVRPDGKGL